MSFADLKKKRAKSLNDLVEKAKEKPYASYRQEGFWSPKLDKSGNYYAEVRFMPAAEGDDFPWIQLFEYKFKGPTGVWYSERCRTTIGEDDPVKEYISALWATKDKANETIARKYKRKLKYVVNILVLKDPLNPENEGKVLRWKIGPKVFKMITDAMQPEFEDEAPFSPFDFWEGATFKVKLRKVEDYPNYDKCEFDTKGERALFGGDEKALEALYAQVLPLAPLIAPETFKTYEELRAKFYKALNMVADVGPSVGHKEPGKSKASTTEEAEKALEEAFDDDEEDDEELEGSVVQPTSAPRAEAEGTSALEFFKRAAGKTA